MVHHDIWDYDTPMAPNLLDITINGKVRKIIAQTTKQGWIYTFDRETGVADLADARDAGASESGAGRGDVEDATDSLEARAVRAAGTRGRRSHRLHAGDQGGGTAPGEALRDGAVLHSAVGHGRHDEASLLVVRARRERRREHRRRRGRRSGNRPHVRRRAVRTQHDRSGEGPVLGASVRAGTAGDAADVRAPCLHRRDTCHPRVAAGGGRCAEARGRGGGGGQAVQLQGRVARHVDNRGYLDPEAPRAGRHHGLQHEHRGQGVVDSERRRDDGADAEWRPLRTRRSLRA